MLSMGTVRIRSSIFVVSQHPPSRVILAAHRQINAYRPPLARPAVGHFSPLTILLHQHDLTNNASQLVGHFSSLTILVHQHCLTEDGPQLVGHFCPLTVPEPNYRPSVCWLA